MVKILCSALLLFILTACSPEPPFGAYHITRPASYDSLWAQVEQCSGLTGNVARVNFNLVPPNDPAGFRYRGQYDLGLWISYHQIYIGEWYRTSPLIIRHEMLHDLLGHTGHPGAYFCGKCENIIATVCVGGKYMGDIVDSSEEKW